MTLPDPLCEWVVRGVGNKELLAIVTQALWRPSCAGTPRRIAGDTGSVAG
jgi:hypothetical protein